MGLCVRIMAENCKNCVKLIKNERKGEDCRWIFIIPRWIRGL
jgi:hypothetical protein